jgi:ribosomal protein S18 acetylase RimI-like enzyme
MEPWHSAASQEVLPLLRREYTRWSVDLGWDLARDWAAVDPARRSGLLAGWLARDAAGAPSGLAFGVDLPDTRQLAAVIAEDGAVVDGLLATATGDPGRHTLFFGRVGDGLTVGALERAGFTIQPYAYLVAPIETRPLTDVIDEPDAVTSYSADDSEQVAALLMSAYASDRTLRPFARAGTIDDWRDYVNALTLRPGCGVFSPDASVLIRRNGELQAVALVSSIGATTAHLGQFAIAPARRGQGLSHRLLALARARAARVLGASRCSLLVSEANPAALKIYAAAGFNRAGCFAVAFKPGQRVSR